MTVELLQAVLHWSSGIGYTHILAVILLIWFWKDPRVVSAKSQKEYYQNNVHVAKRSRPAFIICEKTASSHKWLHEQLPESTESERHRFLVANKGDARAAVKRLAAYLDWRQSHSSIEEQLASCSVEECYDDEDLKDWTIASSIAMKAREEKEQPLQLPRVARTHKLGDNFLVDREGHIILQIIPGKMDERLVNLTTYALAIALYIDRKLDRQSFAQCTVLIDVRGGRGWRNLHATKLLPFLQHTCQLLLAMFPERLSRSLVYPVPGAFGWIWNIARRCIDPETADKIHLLTGKATIASAPPVDQMVAHLDESLVEHLEQERLASFETESC